MLIRNSWYVAAWSEDVKHGQLFARTIVGEPLVFLRTKSGEVAAMDDRCPHRRMPLSLGRIMEDDRLVCGYHGLAFDPRGVCVNVPGQPESATRGICVRSYPVVERYGLIWIWMGAAEQADPAAIVECRPLEQPGWHQTRLYRHTKANYLLLNDNLADLLHVAYLHTQSGIGNEHMGPAKTELELTDRGYHFARETNDIPSPPIYANLSNAKKNVDRWHIVDYIAPSIFLVHTGVAEVGTGGAKSQLTYGAGRWTFYALSFITPETENTTHYFKVLAHEWTESSDSWRQFNQVIDEDIWAVEAQQRNIDLQPDAVTTPILSDSAMFEMRKIIRRLEQAEDKPAGQPARAAVRLG
ncbi:MAG TPA: aromatic ring-hydroxylating dioxygenase subunit alpha [Burkholderiales bacterium]|nr:aromatic ring-hydroxylating dioxygenase subunit alpha [Burkholderiales bacterium]